VRIVAREHGKPNERCPLCHVALDSRAIASNGQLTRCKACGTLAHSGCLRDLSGGRCPVRGCSEAAPTPPPRVVGRPAPTPAAAAAARGTQACPHCAERLPAGAVVCPACAEPVVVPTGHLRWQGDVLVVPRDVPLGGRVCWLCARSRTLQAVTSVRGLPTLRLPVCVGCHLRALALPLLGLVLLSALPFGIIALVVPGLPELVAVLALALVVCFVLLLVYLRRPRARVAFADAREVGLELPRPDRLRQAFGEPPS
jgi:hypothetical protein